jgi:hypothetical protein
MSRSHVGFTKALRMLGKHGEVQHNGIQYWIHINGYSVGFFKNGSDSTTCYTTRRLTDHSDMQSDYDACSYWDNLTQAIRVVET